MRSTAQLRPRPEHVFELLRQTADTKPAAAVREIAVERPELPAVLAGPGPFVGRSEELAQLLAIWQMTLAGGMRRPC